MPPRNEAMEEIADDTSEPGLRADVDTLKADLLRIKDDLALIADSVRTRVRSQAQSTRANATTRYQDSMDSIEQYIEEKPLTTVLVAFGVGLLLGKIFSLK